MGAPPSARATDANALLAALPAGLLDQWRDELEPVPMRLGDELYGAGHAQRHVWFPTTAVVSLHHVTRDGACAETAGVGREGMVGVTVLMGGESTPSAAMVQTSGHGYRLRGDVLRRAFDGGGVTRQVLLRYLQALITQICQTAVCYRHHSIEQQFSRLLLATVDRSPPGELVLTQELVAGMLGVRRESITQAATTLQAGGYIRYRRGHITVLDAVGLRRAACECYGVVKAEMQRLLSGDARALPGPA